MEAVEEAEVVDVVVLVPPGDFAGALFWLSVGAAVGGGDGELVDGLAELRFGSTVGVAMGAGDDDSVEAPLSGNPYVTTPRRVTTSSSQA